jgi:SNF2 family DNA or RNA helicase
LDILLLKLFYNNIPFNFLLIYIIIINISFSHWKSLWKIVLVSQSVSHLDILLLKLLYNNIPFMYMIHSSSLREVRS